MDSSHMAALYAVGSAAAFAFYSVFVRRGQQYANATTGVLIGLIVSAPLLGLGAALSWEPAWWDGRAILLFSATGLAGQALGRMMLFLAIHRIGVARAMPLNAVVPLFAAALAFLFLGERPRSSVWVGTLLIVAGSASLSYKKRRDASWNRRDLWIPLLGAFAFAVSFLLRKIGLSIVPSPSLGAAVASAVGLAFLFSFAPLLPAGQRPCFREPMAWWSYGLGGGITAVNLYLYFQALNLGEVSIVVPLGATAPLFSLVFSSLLLRDLERVTALVVIGTGLTVAGAALIGISLR